MGHKLRIARSRLLVGCCKGICQEARLASFIERQQPEGIVPAADVREGERCQSMFYQRDVHRNPRRSLIAILERLDVRNKHHGKECLLKGILDSVSLVTELVENFLELVWIVWRQILAVVKLHHY